MSAHQRIVSAVRAIEYSYHEGSFSRGHCRRGIARPRAVAQGIVFDFCLEVVVGFGDCSAGGHDEVE